MYDAEWLESRLKERAESRKLERKKARNPNLTVIDASKFTVELSALAVALTNKVEREGPETIANVPVPLDIGIILRQLTHSYNLLRFINSDEMRFENLAYRQVYSFVALPIVRTLIDGFYNCTAMLDDPSRSRAFRVSGYYRMREALKGDEDRYSRDPAWEQYLFEARRNLENGMRADGISDSDMDNKANRWPLLGEYIRLKPDTPHKELLRRVSLGLWQEYSSISHTSFDGLVSLYPFIAGDRIPRDKREDLDDAAERYIAMHIGRASGLLLALLTEIQHFYKFDGAEIDERLGKIWAAVMPILEVRELYHYRYKGLLRIPLTEPEAPLT